MSYVWVLQNQSVGRSDLEHVLAMTSSWVVLEYTRNECDLQETMLTYLKT
jgi:hypothetical protein